MHDITIIDTGGRLGAATGTMFRFADQVVLLVDETPLGVSAACHYLELLLPLMKQREASLRLLAAGTRSLSLEVRSAISSRISLPSTAWDLPSVPYDRGARDWAGEQRSLYEAGCHRTKLALEELASALISAGKLRESDFMRDVGLKGLMARVFHLPIRTLRPA